MSDTARPAETVSESVPARHETPDVAELRRLYSEWQETVNPYGFRLMPSGEYYALAAAAVNAIPALLDDADALRAELAHMTEARNNARAEVKRLTAKLDAIEADGDKLSIMFGWLVHDVGEHTCGGYGPESGYAHEPGCGFEPVLRLDKLEGWPGEKPLDGRAES